MIILKLLNHQWKETLRSTFWQRSILLNIFLVIASLYIIMCVISIGYFADEILAKIFKGRSVIDSFTGLLFYYFSFDLIMRFLVQKVPVVTMQPYLTLPLKKSTLLHYPLIKTIPGFFNLIAICLMLPFWFKVILPATTISGAFAWLITVISLIAANNYMGFMLKKYFAKRPLLILFFLALIVSLFYLDLKAKIGITGAVTSAFKQIGQHPFYTIIPVLFAGCMYWLAFLMLRKNSYIEEDKKVTRLRSPGFSFLSRLGEPGIMMQNELRMVFRNKRPRAMLWLGPVFMLYGFIFYNPHELDKQVFLLFAGFFVTSAPALLYGQYFFAWESSYFDMYLANRISLRGYLRSKFWLYSALCIISYIITLPYALFGHNIALINFSLFVYNIGVTSFLYILIGTYSRSRIDLGKSQFMNYEGTGAAQWLGVIPIMGIPMIILGLCALAGNTNLTYFILIAMGVSGLLFNEHILSLLTRIFLKNKYKMAVAFRKK